MTDIRRFETLDSTNEEASRLASNGERGPLWIVARSQSAGRGRRGRDWISSPGNLFASYLIEIDVAPAICAELSFVAALALGDLVAGYASGADTTLKWPNDILLNSRKVAGILIEVVTAGTASRVIVGCGVNLAHCPEGTEYPATSIAEFAEEAPNPQDALGRLVVSWDAWYEVWRNRGFEAIRSAWLTRADGLGKKLTVRLEDSEIEGVFESLADDGTLLLRVEGGSLERVTAGDVFPAG